MATNYYTNSSEDSIDGNEHALYELIMAYRASLGLPAIPLSAGLTATAGRHALDSVYNTEYVGHAWSDRPYDGSDASTYPNMWEAPQRLNTSYLGNGYEISTGFLGDASQFMMTPAGALQNWQGSAPHNAVITNSGIWTQAWNAIGIGMHKGIAHVWFGHEADPGGAPRMELTIADTGTEQSPAAQPTLAQVFAAGTNIPYGVSAAYQALLGGVPNEAGFLALINAAVSTNFGAGPGPTFNIENIFINLTNNLVQGNPAAKARFDQIATGTTLEQKITAIYQALVPPSKQTAEGLAFITRPDGITFYQSVAAERGVAGTDGAAIVAMASLLQTVVSENIGVGNAVQDLIKAVIAGSDALPASGSSFTDIEVADGTAFDADDGAAIARIAAAPEPAPFIYIDDESAGGPFEPGAALALVGTTPVGDDLYV